jgi:tetratricopeptide (TPR) repeat protein
MAKILKKAKRWFEDYGRILGISIVVIAVLAAGIWHASSLDTKAVQEDFGDASISDVAKEISNLDYEDALVLWEEGEEVKARAVMARLAPLKLSSKKPEGNGFAHFWLAKDLLAEEDFGFLKNFPLDAAGGKRLESPVALGDDELIAKAQRHLEAAVALTPKELEPVVMLAEFLVAKGKRNEAIALLQDAISTGEGVKVDLGIYVANVTRYKGDELGLEESGWHRFSTLGKAVTGRSRGDVNVRLDYLFTGLLLKEFDVVNRSIRTFERDFDGQNEVVSAVKTADAYFRAIDLLAQEQLDSAKLVELLLEAQKYQPEREEILTALKSVLTQYPEHKGKAASALEQSLSTLSEGAEGIYLLLADMVPDREGEFLEQAVNSAPLDEDVVVRNVAYQLEQGGGDFALLRSQLERVDTGGSSDIAMLDARIAMGQERWMDAIVLLEKVLAESSEGKSNVHALLAQAYRATGDALLADEHLAQK